VAEPAAAANAQDNSISLDRTLSLQLRRESLQEGWRNLGKGQADPDECSVQIAHGGIINKRKSKMQAHLAKVSNIKQVNEVYETLLAQFEKNEVKTHSIAAYRFWDDITEEYVVDCDDNLGSGAGSCLIKLLEKQDASGVFIMVTQWHLDGDKPYLNKYQDKRVREVAQFLLDSVAESSKTG